MSATIIDIPVIAHDTIDVEDFVAHAHQPYIIRGAIDQWPARDWNFETLRRFGTPDEWRGNLDWVHLRPPHAEDEPFVPFPTANLGALRAEVGAAKFEYEPTEWCLPVQCPELAADVRIPRYFANDWLARLAPQLGVHYPRILIGYANTGSALHYDVFNTASWMAMIHGKKDWLVFPPSERKYLAPFAERYTPDTDALLAITNRAYRFTLEAGDLLFVPSSHYHQVENQTDSIAVTYNLFNEHNVSDVLGDLFAQGTRAPEVFRQLARLVAEEVLAA